MKYIKCFDFGGTITNTEVLPCIASELGISEEIDLSLVCFVSHNVFSLTIQRRSSTLKWGLDIVRFLNFRLW